MILTVTLNTSIDKLYMLERLAPYTVMRVERVNNTAGGKGLNVSRVAAQLGEDVTAMGFVGGHIGQYFESLITQPRIRKAFTRVESETRSCINGWDMEKNLSTEYLEPGAPVTAPEVERFLADFARQLPGADAVALSGSVPQGVPADCYATLIGLCRQAGKPVLLDTSGSPPGGAGRPPSSSSTPMRSPSCWAMRPKAGRSWWTWPGCAGKGWVSWLFPAQGALTVCDEGVCAGTPPTLTPKNTVGCGDSMVAGFAVALVRRLDARERLRLAIGVSAANALSMSTGGYDPQDLEAILPRVEIRRVE